MELLFTHTHCTQTTDILLALCPEGPKFEGNNLGTDPETLATALMKPYLKDFSVTAGELHIQVTRTYESDGLVELPLPSQWSIRIRSADHAEHDALKKALPAIADALAIHSVLAPA